MHKSILIISKYTLLEAINNRLLWLVVVILVSAFGLVQFIGDLAVTDQKEIQLTFLASFLRYSGIVLIAIVVVSANTRELQDKTLELILALAISRSSYYLGKLIGFSILCLIMSVMFSGLLLLYANADAVVIWSVSYLLELILVASLSLLMLFSFRQIPAALSAVFLFYVLAKNISSIILIAKGPLVATEGIGQQFIEGFFNALNWLLPDLDKYSQTAWLVYGDIANADLSSIFLQSIIYIPLLSAVALIDFYRKNIA